MGVYKRQVKLLSKLERNSDKNADKITEVRSWLAYHKDPRGDLPVTYSHPCQKQLVEGELLTNKERCDFRRQAKAIIASDVVAEPNEVNSEV